MKKEPDNTWVELNTRALATNIRLLRENLSSGTDICFVVKSNAYGHGLSQVAQCALHKGITKFAVIHIEEALQIRAMSGDADIIIMGVISPEDVAVAINKKFSVYLTDLEHARELSEKASRFDGQLDCHVVIDTGMGRLGVFWDSAADVVEEINKLPGLRIGALTSHFASAETCDKTFARTQMQRFKTVKEECSKRKLETGGTHISSSGGILSTAEWDLDTVRPGILLYGYGAGTIKTPDKANERRIPVKPVLQWKTRVIQVRQVPKGFHVSYGSSYITDEPTKIGILNAGYADGYPRALSNKGEVIIRGQRAPVIGKVTMNLTAVELGLNTDIQKGDEAILIGEHKGTAVWADDLAGRCGTISYEILTNIRTNCRIVIAE